MRKIVRKLRTEVDTDYGVFSIVLEREPDMGGYMVTVPKVSDVITWGKNLTDAKCMAREAIECSVEGDVLIAAEKEGLVTLRKQRAHA